MIERKNDREKEWLRERECKRERTIERKNKREKEWKSKN